MREIYIRSNVGLLDIGRRGENIVTRVHLPEVPESGQAVTVYVLRNGDTVAYPASNVEITDTEIVWTVTSVDTGKSGRGKVQYKFADSVTGEVIKTEIYGFVVGLAIDTEVGPAPDPYESWLDSLTDLAGQAQEAAREAEDYAESASESAEQAEAEATRAAESAEEASQSEQTTKDYLDTMTEQVMPTFQQIAQSTLNAADAASNSEIQAQVARDRAITAQAEAESAARQASASADTANAKASEASQSSAFANAEANRSKAYSEAASASAGRAYASETSAGQSATAAEASATSASQSATTATAKAAEASASATAAQAAQTGAETAQAGAESAAETAQAGADAVGLLREQIYNSYPNVEAEEGPIVSISDGADGIPVKSLVVGIEPVQAGSGDPSPTNVRPITGWTGAGVKRTGKNLWDEEWEAGTLNASTGEEVTSNVTMRSKNFIPIKPGMEYIPVGPYNVVNTNQFIICYYDKDEVNVGYRTLSKPGSFVVPSDGRIALMRFAYRYYLHDSGGTYNNNVSVNYPSTATDYEPYQGETYDISFPSEAGTVYGGSLDVTSGVLTVDRAQIASYNGETLPGEWISDRDVYAAGTTPTIGAQVVYKLSTPVTYQLTPTEVQTLLGSNAFWADTGDVQEMAYRADTKLYIDGVYEEYQDDLADYASALAALG